MSSEHLASAQNQLKGDLAGSWNILDGASGQYTDLGIARRFGGAAAAYSLRDVGAMNGPVVNVRREPEDTTAAIDDEVEFSANQVQSGALEDWVNGKLENTLPADVATAAAAYSLRKVKASYSGNAVQIRRSSDQAEVDVAFDSEGKVSNSSLVTDVTEESESGGTQVVSSGATTLGDFISGTDAFVVTWYDQAGSNDATQTTSANQPVIAESGTLLTNSMGTPTLKFVGGGLSGSSYTSGDNLDANGLASSFTGEDKAISSFVVTSAFANDKNGVIYGFGDSSDDSAKVTSLFHSGGGMGIQLRDDADNAITDQTNVSYSSNEDLLFSFTRPNTTYDLNKNSVNLRNDIASDLGTTTLDRFSIGTLTRTSQALFLDGDITELIIYASDQSDNRFKIESNINNYYGLYNDGNDTSDTEWQFHNTETGTSANGTDGYVFKNSDADVGIASLELKQGVVSGDVIYYSFFYDRTTGSPTVRLASDETDSNSSVSNNDQVGTSTGFISGTLTATGTGSFFMIADNDSPSDFTISNFRMSRIARNGLVETWYDQSGNGNDATQSTAGNQPQIVVNGGQVIETQGKPAIGFQQTDTSSSNQEFLNTTSDVSVQAMYATLSIKDTNIDEQTVVGHGSDNNKFIAIIKQAANPSSAPRVRETSTDLKYSAPSDAELDTGIVFSYNRNASNNNVVRINNGNSAITSGTDTNLNTDIVIQMVGARTGGLDSWRGNMQEVILFDRDTEDDRADLQNDMANFYNITLS
jgi:hypothetical protein